MKRIVVCVLILIFASAMLVACVPEGVIISFYTDGTLYSRQEIFALSELTMPPDPPKTDCVFVGWYTDNVNYKVKYEFDTMPQKDLNLYAKWAPAYE